MPDHRPAVVVDEGEEISLSPAQPEAMQRIPGPQLVGRGGLKAPEHRLGRLIGGERDVVGEVALQGPLARCPPNLGAQDAPDLGRGALGVFPLERNRGLDDLHRQPGAGLARAGHQRVEPAGPPSPNPAVQGVAGDPHRPAGRVQMLLRGDLAHQPAPSLG